MHPTEINGQHELLLNLPKSHRENKNKRLSDCMIKKLHGGNIAKKKKNHQGINTQWWTQGCAGAPAQLQIFSLTILVFHVNLEKFYGIGPYKFWE